MSTSDNFTRIKKAFKARTGASLDVTWRALSLGERDSVTGWREKNWAESTIEMIIIPRAATSLAASSGVYVRLDAIGLTLSAVSVSDEIKDADNDYYEVKTVKKHKIGDQLFHYECSLTHLPLHD